MTDTKSLVEAIQADILDPDVPLSVIFLKTNVLARKLNNNEFEKWVKSERDGYDNDTEIPDYRITSPLSIGTFANVAWLMQNQPVPLGHTPDWFQENISDIHIGSGIRSIEQLAANAEPTHYAWKPEWIQIWNELTAAKSSEYMSLLEVRRSVSNSFYLQLLDTVRSRLQDFILEIADIPWSIESKQESIKKVGRLFQLTIHNNQGASMAIFDQRSQNVQNQNKAAHDVNVSGEIKFGNMLNQQDFVQRLHQLKDNLNHTKNSNIIDAEIVTDVDFEIANAIQQSKKPQPDKNAIISHLEKAKLLVIGIASAASIVTAIVKLIEVAQTLF